MKNIVITGKVSIGLCNWLYEDIREGKYSRHRSIKLLRMVLQYNTNNKKDSIKCVYFPLEQKIKFYNGKYVEKQIWFKKNLAF